MSFTALHRALGRRPGELTDELLDAAVADGVAETVDLDWKSELPPSKGLPQTDFPKDVAAMANSGGGIIVYGVHETQKAATARADTGELTEAHERSLHGAAVSAITPPVFGLKAHRLGNAGNRAVIVEVPASADGPHLVFRGEYFGAPLRNDADTVWMKERQIEAMYRARFDERRHASEALDTLFAEASDGRDTSERAWLIAAAHPRIPRVPGRLSRDDAREVLTQAGHLTLTYASNNGLHPLSWVDHLNPRPGLRRWIAAHAMTGEQARSKDSWASVHYDGSVTLATVAGGHPTGNGGRFEGSQVRSAVIECTVADLMALMRAAATATDRDEYDVRVGIGWTGQEPLIIPTVDKYGSTYGEASTPLHRYTPVETTVNAAGPDPDFHVAVHDLALDCVNQGGVSNLVVVQPPAHEDRQL